MKHESPRDNIKEKSRSSTQDRYQNRLKQEQAVVNKKTPNRRISR